MVLERNSTALARGQAHYGALATAEAVVLHRALDRAHRTREFLPEDRRIRAGEERTRTLAHNIEWWRRVGHAWNSPLTRFLVTRERLSGARFRGPFRTVI